MMLWEYIPSSTRYHLFLLLVSPTRQSQQNQGLSGRLGHHSPSFTLSTYIKKRDEQDKVGAEQFSRMVQGFAAKHAEQQAVEEVSESGD